MNLEIFKKEDYSEKRVNGRPQPDPRPTRDIMKLIQSHIDDVQGLLDEMKKSIAAEDKSEK